MYFNYKHLYLLLILFINPPSTINDVNNVKRLKLYNHLKRNLKILYIPNMNLMMLHCRYNYNQYFLIKYYYINVI